MSAIQRLDPQGNVDVNLPIRAVNRGDRLVTWKYDRVKYALEPGVPAYVPYLAMCLYQGDPRAINLPTGKAHEQYRRNEYARLRVVHGVYADDSKWEAIPKIDCYPIDSDVTFATVLADPEGTSLSEQSATMNETKLLQDSLEQMASQMRAMQAQLAQQRGQEAAIVAAGMDPTDLDRQATTSRALSPEEATGEPMVGTTPQRKSPSKAAKSTDAKVTTDGE